MTTKLESIGKNESDENVFKSLGFIQYMLFDVYVFAFAHRSVRSSTVAKFPLGLPLAEQMLDAQTQNMVHQLNFKN